MVIQVLQTTRSLHKRAALSQKIGNESGDRLYTLCKMQEMPVDTKRGEILHLKCYLR